MKSRRECVYTRELDKYKAHAATKDKNVVPFVERLFAWAEQHGPAVEVRFRRKKSESIERADQYVAKTPSFMGEVSYPSRQFDEKHSTKRETVLGKLLAEQLRRTDRDARALQEPAPGRAPFLVGDLCNGLFDRVRQRRARHACPPS